MTEDGSDVGVAQRAGAAESDAALARYGTRMRRQRGIYYVVLAAVVTALVVIVSVAYSHGEAAHATLHTEANPPHSIPIGTPSGTQHVAWRSGDHAALGTPQWGGTIVGWSAHTVRGRNARTGTQTWSYTRTDRTVCAAVQTAGTTVAVFELAGNCDEVTALDSSTGARRWTRTLDENGQPLFGHPTYQVLSFTVMITTPTVIYAIDPSSGYDRWTYSHFGCRITHAVLGTAGALISQNCTRPRCTSSLKFCGGGPQLLLRDGVAGENSNDHQNPDKIIWNQLGDTDIPASADTLISAVNTSTHQLDTVNSKTGKPVASVPLLPKPAAVVPIDALSLDGPELIWIADRSYLVAPDATRTTWSTATPGPPTASVAATEAPTVRSRLVAPASSGARLLDGTDGSTAQHFTLSPAPPAGASVYSLGTGFLVADPRGGITVFR